MVGIDTSVLVRHVVQDDEEQAALACEFIENRLDAANQAHIPLIVLCEFVWVLRTAYGYSRKQVARALRQLLVTDCFAVERHDLAWNAYCDYDEGTADYADCVIARINRDCAANPTVTFDRKAARGEGFHLLAKENL
jgi:predicted nucleic-acid-binding protein